jgi:hypothetical protein
MLADRAANEGVADSLRHASIDNAAKANVTSLMIIAVFLYESRDAVTNAVRDKASGRTIVAPRITAGL